MTTPDISVVIPTYNRIDTLRHVIPSLLRQDLRADRYEIVVADSLSNDGTAADLAQNARE
jgi:glycosyltransferase involved in cell wall biosynthesis